VKEGAAMTIPLGTLLLLLVVCFLAGMTTTVILLGELMGS
jgi:hypothetical protein